MWQLLLKAMFNGQIECSLSLNIVIQIKGNNYFTRISFVESIYIGSNFFVNTNLQYRHMYVDFWHIKFWLQEESINILQGSRFQWIFSWKWNHAYLCNIHNLTSQFAKGFIVTGYLQFERNYLKIFIQVSVCYVFSIFYSIFIICIFVAFCCIQSVAFCRFLVPFKQIFQHFYHVQLSIFLPFFLSVSCYLFVATCLSFFLSFSQYFSNSPFHHFVVLF